MELNWVREYNKLFAAINNQGNPTYFSGGRFIDIIREFDPTFADYNQYIAYRNSNGLSTSRKNFFYDILNDFKDDIRRQIIVRIWEEVKLSSIDAQKRDEQDIIDIPVFHQEQEVQAMPVQSEARNLKEESVKPPKVFISYSWDDLDHINWILGLSKKLIEKGVEIILDKYELGPGKNMVHFMEESIKKADKVVIIFTENYKLKADKREGGVGYEYSILNINLYRTISTNNKYIPVLKSGTIQSSFPEFIQQFITVDMVDNFRYDEKFNELLLAIYDQPQIEKPPLGDRPDFV